MRTLIGRHELYEPLTPTTTSPNPQAGVTFDERSDEQKVIVQVISMENADTVTVETSQGSVEYNQGDALTAVGETAEVTELEPGAKITVIGEFDGKRAVLQTYTYTGEH